MRSEGKNKPKVKFIYTYIVGCFLYLLNIQYDARGKSI